MKYLLFLFLLLGFIACRKEEIDPYVGKLQAKLNNNFGLVGMDVITLVLNDSLTVNGSIIENEIVRWQLNFNKLPNRVGRFILSAWGQNSPTFFLTEWVADGDMGGRLYLLPETKESNYIEITSYNPETGDIVGRFEFTAYGAAVQGSEMVFDLQDSMSFTNGEFYTRIRP